jgi:hypothetical protein
MTFTAEVRIGHYVRGGGNYVAHTVKGPNKRGGIVTYCGVRIDRPSYDIPRAWADCQSCRWERDR